jgi:flagellum-specific peptidoglycan hydrolase FlgJ
MTPSQREWILTTAAAAAEAKHIFPRMAACEAALESGFGSSALARQANNLFGMKQHQHPAYGTVMLPTREFFDGEWTVETDAFVKYGTLEECFEDRMETLARLAPHYPHYAAAIAAADDETYVTEVSKSWSSDPAKASKVIAIFDEVFLKTNNSEAVQDASAGEN